MYLDTLAPAWRKLHQKLLAQVRILVVDGDTDAREAVRDAIGPAGVVVETCSNAEEALERIALQPYDLLITEMALPGIGGIDLVSRAATLPDPVPAIAMSARADLEAITRAFDRGASDYVLKPVRDPSHLRSRIRTLIDRRITSRLFDVMVHDLRAATPSLDTDALAHVEIGAALQDYRAALEARTDVMVCDDNEVEAGTLIRCLNADGLTTSIADQRESILAAFEGGGNAAIAAIIALELPGALDLIEQLRQLDPHVEILVTAESSHVEQALAAVRAGAADFTILADEGVSALVARVRRLVGRGRRHRRYLHLVTTLSSVAQRDNPELAEVFAEAANPPRQFVMSSDVEPPDSIPTPRDEGIVSGIISDNAWSPPA